MEYLDFVKSKITLANTAGIKPKSRPHQSLKPHQKDIARWAIEKGQAAIFAAFGLGKSRIQLQVLKWVHEATKQPVLVIAPLGVKQEFTVSDGPAMGMKVQYVRNTEEALKADTPYMITNYERVVNGNLDVSMFSGVSLDEASLLRSLGSKTTQTFFDLFQNTKYKYVATATPSPNSFKELLHYAHFLGIMDTGQALTRFFQRNSKEAGDLTIMPSQEREFWLWLASWSVFVNRPSDLGHDDTGYDLPKINIHWHEVKSSLTDFGIDPHGQTRLLPVINGGLKEHAKNRRDSEDERLDKALEIVSKHSDEHWLIWHDLESERYKIEKRLPEAKTVYGSQDLDERESLIVDFSQGKYKYLATKPSIAGSGCNFQHYCNNAVFVGVDFKFNDIIQAVHRIYRFMQGKEVNIHFVYSELQAAVKDNVLKKWAQHEELVEKMQLIIKEHGLSQINLAKRLERKIHDKRVMVEGQNFIAINNDCVVETAAMADNSLDQIITSIPFSNHYEYSPSYNDFGHNEDDAAFFKQMDFLVPELYRALKPGRMACIHVKDRIMYGNVTGVGMYHLNPFSDMTVENFRKHGFVYMGRITIDTDVVRENAQTYRLGWTENSKDSTKMGVGSPEYVLLFRKWTPDMSVDGTANGPEPVTKDNEEYTRSRWQIHASGIWRSSGNRLLDPHLLRDADFSGIIKTWREKITNEVYDLEAHIAQCEAFEEYGRLPSSWMLFAPHSNNPDIWTDILRINTLNTNQSMKATQNHVCPLQLDVIKRLVERYSNKGDVVFDPFGGIGSVAYESLKLDRKAILTELNSDYWQYAVGYCESIENKRLQPTLFDLLEVA